MIETARSDVLAAAVCLLAFRDNEDSDEAFAGAVLVADGIAYLKFIASAFQQKK